MARLFGTDGIRGVANVAPMDSETAMRLGRAAAHVFRRAEGRHRVLIGKDTRISGYMLETALESGISSMGVDVLIVGPLPTPGIAYLTRSMRADAGVVISASHNSFQDNGIKFFGADGFKLADETEDEIERLMAPGELDAHRAAPEKIGKAFRIEDAIGRYVVFLKSCVDRSCSFEGLKIVIDAANGAAYRVAPLLFAELGATVISVGDRPDGKNINDGVGSLHPEKMVQLVKEHGAFCGIAYDGDADRVIMCDEQGKLIDGDSIMAALAFDFKQKGMLSEDVVVGTVMSNLGLEKALKEKGIGLIRADVGDRYVLQEMIARGANLGGEQSGHIISLDHNTTGDGILSSLLMVALAKSANKAMSHYSSLVTRFPQELVAVKVKSRTPLPEIKGATALIASAEKALGDRGRLLVRYSGTELKLRIMAECEDAALCSKVVADLQKRFGELLN